MRLSIVLSILLCLAVPCHGLDRKQFADAIAAVDANLKTPAGKQYEAKFGQEFSEKYIPSMKGRKRSAGALENFDMFIRLKADGKVDSVLIHPETSFTTCVRDAVLNGKFSFPPHDEYWVNVHTDFKK